MNRHGFSLIELIIVIAIMGIILAIATLSFQDYSNKANIESQVKSLYSDIIQLRTTAMFKRTGASATYNSTTFKVFSSNTVTAAPIFIRSLKYPISTTGQINFDSHGLTTAVTNTSICVMPGNNNANIDSIVIGTVRTQMGKSNGTCNDTNITPK